ncbi:MAG TPA: tetratricopeptide repeat protein [Vicinamibacterales bacterium]|nr:tetratricopeptide repeat protein [Vicinamibacterales bacterium]
MRAVLIVAFFALLAEVSLGFHGQGLAAPGRGSAFIATAATAGRSAAAPRTTPPAMVGNAACKPCHQGIYDSYARTAMARTSGPAFPPLEGSFRHAASNVSYRVYRDGRTARLSYERVDGAPLRGTLELKYYVGSNSRGRTFLFDIEGFLYQAPINYYAARNVWDMSPGYAQLQAMELNHPVDSTCLFCHASRVQPVRNGTVNGFAGVPFLQDGVACERCHGAGSDHVKRAGPMVNPAKLAGERRASICVQCHLEGQARIARAGRSEQDYKPGDLLSDDLAIFVRDDDAEERRGAVSHVESLALSLCKRKSGEALSCITCHDPHMQPGAREKADYYRPKCVGCHAPKADGHYQQERDCPVCHMPRMDSADVGHTVVTDHRIVRTPSVGRSAPRPVGRLVPFGGGPADARDLGLAYGEVALRGDALAVGEALRLLEVARQRNPDDADVLTRLGYLHQASGDMATAERYYEQALKRDPDRAVAAANLGVFYASRGMVREAVDLWRTAFQKNPQLSEIGVNLGRELCEMGDAEGARAALQRVLTHNPDFPVARQALADVAQSGCPRK